jgi:AraC family transcriptional regulator of adaptative response / DNA-3-methyladenine glycosylase II
VEIDQDALSRAFLSRDRRFEGRFVAAVVTTGIYCRPGCPAPLPRPRNIRIFRSPAAAEEGGFRPCRRCRPDASPGTPVLLGTGATVSRALRLIGEGAYGGSQAALAGRLGVGERHLRRLFEEHLGAAPGAVIRTQRTHFARRLLDESRLSLADVAAGAGFSSLRSFHRAVRETFGRPPRELRRKAAPAATGRGETIRVGVPVRLPFDWDGILSFLGDRALPGVEEVRDGVYTRTVRTASEGGKTAGGLVSLRRTGAGTLEATLPAALVGTLLPLAGRLGRLVDADADPGTIGSDLSRDPLLAPLVARRPGLRVPGAWDPFETTVRAVLGQQVSVRAAATVAGRIAAKFGTLLPDLPATGPRLLFPTAEVLAEAPVRSLASVGLTSARAAAVHALALAVADGTLDLDGRAGPERLERDLTSLRGIGPWTARYVSMRVLGEPDAFPEGDLGLARALARLGVRAAPRELFLRADAWRPWRAYATMYLWMSEESR